MPLPHSDDAADDTRAGDPADGERLWLPLNALRAFEAVGTHLSFTGAAAALHISQSALSRHVTRLEEHLGCRLLERRSKGLVLTAAGVALLPVVEKSFDRIAATLASLRQAAGNGQRVLRVHMPPTFLHVAGLRLLREFRLAFPNVLVDVSSSNGIGLPTGRGPDLAVVFDRPRRGDAVRDPLWMISQTPACAPALAERCAGMDLATFVQENELLHIKLEGEHFGSHWVAYAKAQDIDITATRGLAFDTEALAVQWAVAGGGVALVDTEMFSSELADGRLVAPFDATSPSGFGYFLNVHPDDMGDPAIALFRSWVIQSFAQGPP